MTSNNEETKDKRVAQRRSTSKEVSEEKRSTDRRSSPEKKRASERRSKSLEVSEENRAGSRRKSTTTTDEKRNYERRNTVLEVADDKRKTDRRKACPSADLPADVLLERRRGQRRNSSIAHTVSSPVTRFKSGVSLDVNKRVKDRRLSNEDIKKELDHIESDILRPDLGGNRKQERRNSSLRGEPPNSPRTRFKSGVPSDTDKRKTDRRTDLADTPSENYIRRRQGDRRCKSDIAYLSLIPGGKDRRTGVERRIKACNVPYELRPDIETRTGNDRRQQNIAIKDDRRKGDRREKTKLNRRDSGIASGIDPTNDRRIKPEEDSISAERRDSGFASGFRPDLDRRKYIKVTTELEGVASGNEEDIENLKDCAPSDELFITGRTYSSDNTELEIHPRKNKDDEEEEVEQRFRTGHQDLPLKD